MNFLGYLSDGQVVFKSCSEHWYMVMFHEPVIIDLMSVWPGQPMSPTAPDTYLSTVYKSQCFSTSVILTHKEVMTCFLHYWPFLWGNWISRHWPVDSPHKGPVTQLLPILFRLHVDDACLISKLLLLETRWVSRHQSDHHSIDLGSFH